MDPLVVRHPPVGKERPQPIRGLSAIGCGEYLSSAIGDPYKLRCTGTSGVSLGVSVVQDTSDWCSWWHSNCKDAQVHRAGGFLKGPAAAYYSKFVFVFFPSLIHLAWAELQSLYAATAIWLGKYPR